jgi:hypothetical protein
MLIFFSVAHSFGIESSKTNNANITLLKFPYPYCAALTISSDTHNTPVETFEAVHLLINTDKHVTKDSDTWQHLFSDPDIEKCEAWHDGIKGFGLPIADSMFLYNSGIAVFNSYDEKNDKLVPNYYNGRDFREIVDDWFIKGWVDTLHTPGPGHIPRKWVKTAYIWLKERPIRHLKVWSNHSLGVTPTCLEPDRSALPYVFKNIIKLGTAVLYWAGLESVVENFVNNPFPAAYPKGQNVLLWLMSFLLVLISALIVICSIVKGLRRYKILIILGLFFVSLLIVLYMIPLHFGLGDNPSSRYYHADLTRILGIRYYWLIFSSADYKSLVPDTLLLPESQSWGRPSILRVVQLDDDSKIIVFGRCMKGGGGVGSLEMLTEQALENLCSRGGTSILYTHWTARPKEVFSAKALEGLRRLQNFYEEGRIWVAPTSEILDFTFIRTFLEFTTHFDNNKCFIEISHVNNPIGHPFVPTLEDLRGISFDCPADLPVEIAICGKKIDIDLLKKITKENRVIICFPMIDPS